MANTKQQTWEYCKGFLGGGNYVLSGEDFYISYNPAPAEGTPFSSDLGSPETALCKDGEYFILNGDFRSSYEELLSKGYAICKNFFDQHAAQYESSWSYSRANKANN